jgi:hypothetical protein
MYRKPSFRKDTFFLLRENYVGNCQSQDVLFLRNMLYLGKRLIYLFCLSIPVALKWKNA